MDKKILLVLLILIALLSWFGIKNLSLVHENNAKYREWKQDSIQYEKRLAEQQSIIKALKPGDDLIQPREESLPSTLANPYLSASQGVEVHLMGIRWNKKWFNSNQTWGINQLGGISEVQLNQIIFDPDFEKSGMPDLNVEVTAPRFFEMKTFLKDWLEGFDLTGFLGKSFSDKKPIKTYNLQTTPDKRSKMNLWLMEFDANIRIQPSPDYDNRNVGNLENHPVSGIPTRTIRNDKEGKNQRYGNVSIMLKFKPKDGTWYIADRDETGMLKPNSEPKIGIGAVECIGIKQIRENKNLNDIGVYVRRGSSLALYNSPKEIDTLFNETGIKQDDVIKPIPETFANPDFFGKEKYAIIHLANLGSWQEGTWLSSITRYADQYFARFVIHTYVLGEWTVQPVSIAIPTPDAPYKQKKPGLLDFILPDFKLGLFGKFLSGGGWIIVSLIVLSIFFPPIATLIKKLLGMLVALIPQKKKQ